MDSKAEFQLIDFARPKRTPAASETAMERGCCETRTTSADPADEADYRDRIARSRRGGFLLLIVGLALYTLLAAVGVFG